MKVQVAKDVNDQKYVRVSDEISSPKIYAVGDEEELAIDLQNEISETNKELDKYAVYTLGKVRGEIDSERHIMNPNFDVNNLPGLVRALEIIDNKIKELGGE